MGAGNGAVRSDDWRSLFCSETEVPKVIISLDSAKLFTTSFGAVEFDSGEARHAVLLPPGAPRLSVLRPKIQIPRIPALCIERERLLTLMNRGTRHKVTVLTAPPGYGKSTLLTQWAISQSRRDVAWVSIDVDDNDLSTLFRHVLAALRQFDRAGTEFTQQVLDGRSLATSTAVHSLLNDLAEFKRPLTIVLDDFQAIHSPEVLQSVNLLIEHLPQSVHLIIASRIEPEINIWRLRSQGEVLEISEHDLRFTSLELADFLRSSLDLELSPAEIEAVSAATEGWIACLHLLSIASQDDSGGDVLEIVQSLQKLERDASELLWAEVLRHQDDAVRSFLLDVSILDRFTSDLCDAVTGGSNTQAMIEYLDRTNLFLVRLDDRGEWFRFHHLMTAAVRDMATDHASVRDVRTLHQRAALWFESRAMLEDAASHAIAGHEWDQVMRLLPTICGTLFREDRLAGMLKWLRDVPSSVLERDPMLCYWLAWALARLGQFGSAMEPLAMAERVWKDRGDAENLAAAQSLRVLQETIRANTDGAVDLADRSLGVLPEDRMEDRAILFALKGLAHYFGGDLDEADESLTACRSLASHAQISSVILSELNTSGSVLMARGKLRDAAALFEQVIATGDPWNHQAVQHAQWLLATVEYERNLVFKASQHLELALLFADRMNAVLHLMQIHQLSAEIAWSRGEHAIAHASLDRASEYAERLEAAGFLATARARRARFWLRANQTVLARRWASDSDLDPLQVPQTMRLFEYMTLIRVKNAIDQEGQALAMLDLVEASAVSRGDANTQIECLVLRALSFQGLGQRKLALEVLDQALEIGAPEGYSRVFLDQGSQLDDLLSQLMSRSPHRATIEKILSSRAAPSTANSESRHTGELILSRREIEILRLVAVGTSNRETADRLFIAEATVKKHLSNIAAKLDSSNRTQAVDKARTLGLI